MTRRDRLALEDRRLDRCPRCGAWRYARACSTPCRSTPDTDTAT